MSPLRYVFINDQGHVFSSVDEPTAEDFEYAAVGMLTILSLPDSRFYGARKRWLPIPPGRLDTAEIDGEETEAFHVVAPAELNEISKHL